MKNQDSQDNFDAEFWLAVHEQLMRKHLEVYQRIERMLEEIEALESWIKLVEEMLDPPE